MSAPRGAGAAAWRRLAHGAVAALGAAALAGCVTTAPRVAGGLWTGRLAVRSDALYDAPAHASTGQFELSGSARHGQLVLSTPLGTVAARARWDLDTPGGGRIELDTGGGPRRYASLDEMMQDAMGESLPLAALFDWLRGRPWTGAPSSPLPAAGGPAGPGFVQLGWTVDLSRFADDRLLVADREAPLPALHVRVKLDPPAAASASAPARAPAPAPSDASSSAPAPSSSPARASSSPSPSASSSAS